MISMRGHGALQPMMALSRGKQCTVLTSADKGRTCRVKTSINRQFCSNQNNFCMSKEQRTDLGDQGFEMPSRVRRQESKHDCTAAAGQVVVEVVVKSPKYSVSSGSNAWSASVSLMPGARE